MKVGINGIGRIGKAIIRANLQKQAFEVPVINDINPDIENIAYQLNFDTTYGRNQTPFSVSDGKLHTQESTVATYSEGQSDAVPWDKYGVDLVIDATGVFDNVLRAKVIVERSDKIKQVMITHSPEDVDFTMVLGANEGQFDPREHKVVSSSICDATALGPVIKILRDNFGIAGGHITTLHPWLNYQNLSDGPASSWSHPGEIYHHYALGRASIGNIIPKPTTAVSAACKVVEGISTDVIGSFSYRTPTSIVGSADISMVLSKHTSAQGIIDCFEEAEKSQKWNIINNNIDPLVSLDFCQSEYSAVVDHRWTDVINGTIAKLVLWYDNEWGYASRVIDQVLFIEDQWNR